MIGYPKSWLAVCFTCMISSGCAVPKSRSVPIEVLYNSNQCQTSTPQTTVINNREQLNQFRDTETTGESHAQQPAVITSAQNPTPTLTEVLSSSERSFDFSKSKLVFIARGRQPNPGYGIHVTGDHADVIGNELVLPVTLTSPDPGRMYPQVIVSPCLLLSAKTGGVIEGDISKVSLQQPRQK